MKNLKLGILGICCCLAGLAAASGNFFAWAGGAIGLIIASAACISKDN